ncbi:MAG: hypothetical protein GX556_19330 [Fibrobacter sp.]|nr:hypothetical protein [Fibrobacter sp.]
MHEERQYTNPESYRKMSDNPSRKKPLNREIADFMARNGYLKKSLPVKKALTPPPPSKPLTNSHVARLLKSKQKQGISEDAAKLIATAIKGLLQSK